MVGWLFSALDCDVCQWEAILKHCDTCHCLFVRCIACLEGLGGLVRVVDDDIHIFGWLVVGYDSMRQAKSRPFFVSVISVIPPHPELSQRPRSTRSEMAVSTSRCWFSG